MCRKILNPLQWGQNFFFQELKIKISNLSQIGRPKTAFFPKTKLRRAVWGIYIFRGDLNEQENSKPTPVSEEFFLSRT